MSNSGAKRLNLTPNLPVSTTWPLHLLTPHSLATCYPHHPTTLLLVLGRQSEGTMILQNTSNYLPWQCSIIAQKTWIFSNTVLRTTNLATLCPKHNAQGHILNPKHHSFWTFDHGILLHYKGKKVKFTLEQAMKAQKGNRGIALLFL
jgi:hypothetical protein